jgi:hypothetical protein
LYVNKVLRDILDYFCTAYINNILIYSENKDDYNTYITAVFKRLDKARLFLDINKSKFRVKRLKYLGLIVSMDGIKIDLDKVQAIIDWQNLRNVKDV